MVFAERRVDFGNQGVRVLRASILLICAVVSVSCTAPTLKDETFTFSESRLAALREAGPPRRVFLITIAGLLSTDFLNARGHIASERDNVRMPNLARMAREGAIGMQAHPPTPGAVYPSHATLVTGRNPIQHGIIADQALDEDGNRSLPYWDNRLLKGTTLWDAAIGRGVLALGWPTTNGARIELVVPDGGPSDPAASWLEHMRNISTPMLMRELDAMALVAAEEADRSKTKDDKDDRSDEDEKTELSGWPSVIEKDTAFAELACRIVASERDPGLWLIRFDQTLSYQRVFGFGSVEVDEALGRVDVEIGRITACLEAADQLGETAIFVTGDVAFQPVHTRIDPNVILGRNSLIGRDPRSSTGVRSWLALSRSNGRSAYIYARDAENAIEARELLEEEAAQTGGFEVVSAADLAEAGADPQAWFGLAAMPGFVIGNGLVQPVSRPSGLRASAGTFPFLDVDSSAVGFVAWGRGVRPLVRVPSIQLADVAPTIATLLGLRLDDTLVGEPLIGILRAAEPLPPPGPKRLGVGGDGDVDRTLRELGGGRELGRDQ
jgi:predicted AlkP superfamily pyrophosphatase or phosphodiesterase